LRGEDYKLASKVKGIDLIISGHTHTKLVEPLIVNGIPIVQTGSYGMNLGRITFDIIGGKPVFSEAILEPIDDEIQGDPDVESLIEERISLINEKLLTQLGLNYQMSVADASFRLVCDEYGDLYSSNLGPLVADAIHSYINRHNAPGSDISIVAAGVIRDAIVPGIQSVPDIFRVMSLGSGNDDTPGYPLSRVYVTGRELKNIIEILLVAREKSSSQFIYYSGVKVRYDSSKGMLRKISSIEIVKGDGSVFDVDITRNSNHLYSISANSYILEFIGIIKKMSFGLIRVEPKSGAGVKIADFNNAVIPFTDKDGALVEGKEWLALLDFLSEMPDISGDGIPDIAQKYAKPEPNIIDIKK